MRSRGGGTQRFLDWYKQNQSSLWSLQLHALYELIMDVANAVDLRDITLRSVSEIITDNNFHYVNRGSNTSYSAKIDQNGFLFATVHTFKSGDIKEIFKGRDLCWEEYSKHSDNYGGSSGNTKSKVIHKHDSPLRQNEETIDPKKAEKLAKTLFYYRYQAPTDGQSAYLESKGVSDLAHNVYGLCYSVFHTDFAKKGIPCVLVPIIDVDGTVYGIQHLLDEKIGDTNKITYGSYRGGKFALIGKIHTDSDKIHVCEGIATGLSIHAAIGTPVVCTLSCENLKNVGKNLRTHYPNAEIVFCADNEAFKDDKNIHVSSSLNVPTAPIEPIGITRAKEAFDATTGVASVYIPIAPPPYRGKDFNDLHMACGLDAVKQCLEKNPIRHRKAIEASKNTESTISPTEDQNRILELLKSSEGHVYIEAETGAGKTYAAAMFLAQCLNARKPFVFFTGTIPNCDDFYSLLEKLAGRTISHEVERVYGDHERYTPREDTIGLIMVSTYLTRRGVSTILRQPISFIKHLGEKPVIVIDEIDAVIQANTYNINLSSRYKKEHREGSAHSIYTIRPKCQGYTKSGNCKNCHLVTNRTEIQVNHVGVPEVTKPKAFFNHDPISKEQLPEFKTEPLGRAGYLSVSTIEQEPNYRDRQIWTRLNEGEIFNLSEGFRDLVEWSLNPMIYQANAMLPDGQFVNQEEILALADEEVDDLMGTGQPQKQPNVTKTIQYPPIACGCEIVSGIDLKPLEYLRRHGERVCFLTATTNSEDLETLKEIFPKLSYEKVLGNQRKIDEVLLIGIKNNYHPNKIKLEQIIPWIAYGEVLIFTADKDDAERTFEPLKEHPQVAMLQGRDYHQDAKKSPEWIRHSHAGKTTGEIRIRIAYLRSIISRAVNFGEAKLNIIDTQSYAPLIAYRPTNDEEIGSLRDVGRVTGVIQAMGRVLRREDGEEYAKRVIVLYGIDGQDDLDQFAQATSNRVEKMTLAFYNKPDKAYSDAEHWYTTGEYVCTERQGTKKRSDQTRRERAMADYEKPLEVRKEERMEASRERALARLEECKREGMGWTQARDFCHLRRYYSENELQKIRRNYNINK